MITDRRCCPGCSTRLYQRACSSYTRYDWTFPRAGLKEHSPLLARMFNALVPAGLQFLRKSLRETVATVDHNLVASLFNILDALLLPWHQREGEAACRLSCVLPVHNFIVFADDKLYLRMISCRNLHCQHANKQKVLLLAL